MPLPSPEVMQSLARNMMDMKLRQNALLDWVGAFGSRDPLKLMWALCSDRKTLFTWHSLNPLEEIKDALDEYSYCWFRDHCLQFYVPTPDHEERVEKTPWSLFWRRAAADVRERLKLQGRKRTKFVMSDTEKHCFMAYLEELEALCDEICTVPIHDQKVAIDVANNVSVVRKRIEKVRQMVETTY